MLKRRICYLGNLEYITILQKLLGGLIFFVLVTEIKWQVQYNFTFKMLNVWRNRGSQGSFSSAVHARFMLKHYRPSYLMVLVSLFDIFSQVRERLSLMYENHSLEKFSATLLSFQLQFWKIFLQLHAVLQKSLGFKCNLLFSLCFLLKKNMRNEVLSYLVI